MHFKNVHAYLDSAAGIAGLLSQAERLVELRKIYKQLVPQPLSRSSSIVNYRQRCVVIFAENSAVAAKLKLLTPRLVDAFSKSGTEVSGIRVQVQPRERPREARALGRRAMSRAGAEKLFALARRLPDARLKQALIALAGEADSTPEPGGLNGRPDAGPEEAK